MKRTACLIVALAGIQASLAAPPPVVSTRVIERGANHEVVESVRVNAAGTALVTNRYTRIGNGLDYQDASGNWVPAEPMVQMFSGGVVCAGASYQAILGTNLNQQGAVDLLTSDKKRIVSRPLGIAFFDPVSGQRILLAKIKDCPPDLVSSNQIVYADAFAGNGVQAAVVYHYDTGRFSQDVKFLNLPVTPSDLGLGNRTRLEILTAIEQCPAFTVTNHVLERETNLTLRATMAQPDLVDETLDFGEMRMPLGHAFPQGQPATLSGPPHGVPVAKQLVTIDGQTVLVESIPWSEVTNQLAKLPQQSARADGPNSPAGLKLELAKNQPNPEAAMSFGSRLTQITSSRPVLLASVSPNSKLRMADQNGFVMDYYITVVSGSPYTFAAGETYLVNEWVYLPGVTFHAGAVIKYGGDFATLVIDGSPSTYYPPGPVIFTSLNDDSVGAEIDESNHNPASGPSAGWELWLEYLDANTYLGPLDFRYAYGGIYVDSSAGYTLTLESASFMDIYQGIQAGDIDSLDVGSAYVCSPDYPSGGTDLYEESVPGTVSIGTVTTCVNQDDNGFPEEYTGTTPNQISGLTLWLEGDQGITQSGGQISAWADQSGIGNNASSSGTYQPLYVANAINGHPVVRFDSANSQYFTLPDLLSAATAAEAFVVLKVNTANPSSEQSLWFMTDDYGFSEQYPDQYGSIQEDFGSTVGQNVGSPSQSLTQYHVYEVSAQAGNWAAWVNGVLTGQTLNNTVSYNDANHQTYLGASGYFFYGYHPQYFLDGDIAEVLIFSRTLTPEERITVNAYLNNKYALVPAGPDAPANVAAHAISQTQIGLTWSESLTNGGATRINNERRLPTGGYTVIAQVSDALSYVDSGLDSGVTYYYRLQAVNLSTWSDYSSAASATTLSAGPDAPFGSLVLWLKADSGLAQGLVNTPTSTPVNLWADQSGNSNHSTQPAAANQPTWTAGALNGLPVIHFNSVNSQYFNLPDLLSAATAVEAFVVLKVPTASPTSQKSLWFMTDVYSFSELYPDQYGNIQEDFGSTVPRTVGSPSPPLTQYHVYEVSAQPNDWAAWVNGIPGPQFFANTVSFNNASHETYLGASGYYFYGYHPQYFFDGDIAEVLIFNRALTSDERTTVNTYLNSKYGLW